MVLNDAWTEMQIQPPQKRAKFVAKTNIRLRRIGERDVGASVLVTTLMDFVSFAESFKTDL